ncbi:hypothetical protein D3C71_511230 [compost metagenome]
MKKTLLFLLGLQLGILANAQTVVYQPLHGNYTNYGYQTQVWNGIEVITSTTKTVWGRDTVIGGETYVQIYQSGGQYAGGIREDVANQQRYYLGLDNIEKNITISHFLQEDDILTDSSVFLNAFRTYLNNAALDSYSFDTLVVGQVDSVLEANGTYSNTYYFEKPDQPIAFFTYNTYRGLLNVDRLEYHVNQFCYRELNSGSPNTGGIICDLGMNENNLLQIELFPNPAAESITLSGEDLSSIKEAAIYDIQGALVKRIALTDTNSGISIEELKNGVYFLSLNGNTKVLRFLKV